MAHRLLVIVLVLVVALPMSAASGLRLEEIQRLSLPRELAGATDVRFDGGDSLVVTAAGYGAAQVRYANGALGIPRLLLAEGTAGGVVSAETLGLSDSHLVVSSSLSQLLWQQRGEAGKAGDRASGGLGTWMTPDTAPISFFEDVDVYGDRLAVLGLMRGDKGMSPDGAVAWFFDVGQSPEKPVPFAYAKAGKRARPFDACVNFLIGKVRFLADGSLVLVPGAEPGILQYSPQGRLMRSWDPSDLDLDLSCGFDDETLMLFGSDVGARLAYVNRFTTVDEVLPTTPEPSLLLRSVDDEGTHWSMVLLAADGKTQRVEVPLTSSSPHARLRGDVLGERILLLMRYPLWDKDNGQPRSAQLIEMRLRSGTEKREGKPAE